MGVKIENRPYGPLSSLEDIEALKERVYLLDDDIIMWQEIPISSVFSVEKFTEKLNEITDDISHYYLLVDLSNTHRPSAKVRATLKREYAKLSDFKHVAVFTGANFMMKIASKFILSFVGLPSYSVHRTMEDALTEIAEHKRKNSVAV
ncbi:MAG: STAS/SEC14 domain-containing protein [Deltaproteobacteria bacterium]|nr:STAS/SEC14 domain-containing protein [Deltaproteobacteria bacterium]